MQSGLPQTLIQKAIEGVYEKMRLCAEVEGIHKSLLPPAFCPLPFLVNSIALIGIPGGTLELLMLAGYHLDADMIVMLCMDLA